MRIVLDTNILISALITTGTPPDQLYEAWRQEQFELVTSRGQVEELTRVIRYGRLQPYLDDSRVSLLLETIGNAALVLDRLPDISTSSDSADNVILATAIAGHADLIVSGDKRHLLSLKEVEGIPIVTAREALERLVPG